jgi:hypothetical protein
MNYQKHDNIYEAYNKFVKSGEKPEKGRILEQVKAKEKRPNLKEIENAKSEYRLHFLKM